MNKLRKKVSVLLILSFFTLNLNNVFVYADSTETPSKEEIQKVEDEIVKLQLNLFNNSKNILEKLNENLSKSTNFEENWDSSLKLKFDEQSFLWKWDFAFNINDYKSKNSMLDSQLDWDVSLSWSFNPVYWTGFEINLKTFASMISKDSEVFLLLKDFDYKINDENIDDILSKVKEQFKDNKYVKFPTDENSKVILEKIKGLTLNDFLLWTQEKLSEPLLTAYKKSWDKYLLVPTKYACEQYFELEKNLSLFNSWYTPSTCKESTYRAFLQKFIKSWEAYLTIWEENNTLWYYSAQDGSSLDISLIYDENTINNFDFIFMPDIENLPAEWFNFNYEKNNYLKVYFKEWEDIFNFDSSLNDENNFEEITSDFDMNWDAVWKFSMKNKKMAWMMYFKMYSYDYSDEWDFKKKLSDMIAVKMSWELWDNNEIKTFNSKIVWIWVQDKKIFLKWNLDLNNWKIKYSWEFSDSYSISKINWTWNYSSKYLKLDSNFDIMNSYYTWKFNLEVDTKDWKNNWNINLEVNSLDKNILNFELKSTWNRTYKENIEISKPKDYIELNEDLFNK